MDDQIHDGMKAHVTKFFIPGDIPMKIGQSNRLNRCAQRHNTAIAWRTAVTTGEVIDRCQFLLVSCV